MTRRMLSSIIFAYLCVSLLSICFSGCGGRPVTDRRRHLGRRYEIAWVEPQIVIADSVFTLIRAERIDSFLVEEPTELSADLAPSVMFHITADECITTVNLFSATNELIAPLLVKKLPRGYYKLTVDLGRFPPELYPLSYFLLKAEYCGARVSQVIRRRP
jgi:hypothetical protein